MRDRSQPLARVCYQLRALLDQGGELETPDPHRLGPLAAIRIQRAVNEFAGGGPSWCRQPSEAKDHFEG